MKALSCLSRISGWSAILQRREKNGTFVCSEITMVIQKWLHAVEFLNNIRLERAPETVTNLTPAAWHRSPTVTVIIMQCWPFCNCRATFSPCLTKVEKKVKATLINNYLHVEWILISTFKIAYGIITFSMWLINQFTDSDHHYFVNFRGICVCFYSL